MSGMVFIQQSGDAIAVVGRIKGHRYAMWYSRVHFGSKYQAVGEMWDPLRHCFSQVLALFRAC